MKLTIALISIGLCLMACGQRPVESVVTNTTTSTRYLCFLPNANHSLLGISETNEIATTRPDGTNVRVTYFEINGRKIKGLGRVNDQGIDASASDALIGQISLKAKLKNGLMQGKVSMLGDIKEVRCYFEHQSPASPEIVE